MIFHINGERTTPFDTVYRKIKLSTGLDECKVIWRKDTTLFYAICWVKNDIYNYRVVKKLKNGKIIEEEPLDRIKELLLKFWLKEIFSDQTPIKNQYIIDNNSKFYIFYNLTGQCHHFYYNKGIKRTLNLDGLNV